ncbi:heterokaryon incompatibility protein-domain-containing protein [Phaeosphaeria sp. MPI-PUGE-AT-0046c]|nr:heterokaryon incompatibility protein-domain-containing protein [Phaeosphaeria sp. MPI-PUGE-AT-0046c]
MADETSLPAQALHRLQLYNYQPLAKERKEIRLLCIPRKTSQSNKRTLYVMFHVSLRDPPEFVALSYCWGDDSLQREIVVNTKTMHITESLATALISLQSDEKDVILWADAISINQKDPIEKTTQVQLMRDIYRTASRVTIWLGPSNSETYYTMREMRKLGKKLIDAGLWDLSSEEILDWDFGDQDETQTSGTKRAILSLKAEHLVQARNDEYPFWWIMSDLGKRPWFHAPLYFRIFSSRSHVHVDTDIQTFWKDNWLTNLLSDALPTTLIGIRRKYLVSGGHGLRTLLDRVIVKDSNSRCIGATDPRDRVYALLGIANDEVATHIVADYTLSCQKAYINTARALLRHGHDDILSLCRIRGECTDLPSWAPDWSVDLRKPWSTWHVHERLFSASGHNTVSRDGTTKAKMLADKDDSPDTQLTLHGVLIDTIKQAGHTFQLGIDDNLEWNDLKPFFDDISEYLSQSELYTTIQKEEAEWRIPIGDTEVAKTNSQITRASSQSHMKAGYHVARAMSRNELQEDEDVKHNFLPFACFRCQLGRMYDSRPFISEQGYVGLCPLETRPGDSIAIFRGARVPYIIRKVEGEACWMLVGESHVYGAMDGEIMATDPIFEQITLC